MVRLLHVIQKCIVSKSKGNHFVYFQSKQYKVVAPTKDLNLVKLRLTQTALQTQC